jgi:hypothetical protein
MSYNILIAGAGQLGSRYLQGLAKCKIPLSIYVYDVLQSSIDTAESRWLEVEGNKTQHVVKLFTSFDQVPREIDVAIVSTNAHVRPDIVAQISATSHVKNWILEKVLAQSEQKLISLDSVIDNESKAWVNTPYRSMKWYNQIKSEMTIGEKFFCEINGGSTFGLACNAIHYLDLLVWLSGETVVAVKTDSLDTQWFKSKREGFWDIFGSIEIIFSKGSRATIQSKGPDRIPITVHIKSSAEEWMIHETEGVAVRNNDFTIRGHIEYQSEMSAPLVESILLLGKCGLTPLDESVKMHIPMLNGLLDHWKKYMPDQLKELPIT